MPQAAQQGQQKTMDEALQESIAAHEAAQQEPVEEQAEAPPQADGEEQAPEPVVDEEGQQEETEAQEDTESEKKDPPKHAKPAKEQPKPGKQPEAKKSGTTAPSSWPPHLREQFHTLPRPIKDQILKQQGEYVRREAAFSRDMQTAKQQIDAFKPLSEALAPFMPHLQAAGVAPAVAVRNLFQTEYVLRTGGEPQKAAIVANLMGSYGITPASVIQSLPRPALEALAPVLVAALEGNSAHEAPAPQPQQRTPERPPKDPRVDILFGNLQRQAQARQAAIDQQDETALHEFLASGKAEFFDDVHRDMMRLARAAEADGQRPSWDELYETACYMNKDVRTVLEKRKADEAAALRSQKAQQARRAASSVKSEPGAPQGTRRPSLDEALRRDIEALMGPQV